MRLEEISEARLVKVAFVTFEYPPKIIGGLGTYAENLVHGLIDKGIDVYTVTRGDNSCRDGKIFRLRTSDRLYFRRLYFARDAIALVRSLHRLYKFDLVHLNGTYPMLQRLQLPIISTFHALPNVKQLLIGIRSFRGNRSARDITFLVLKNPVGSIADFLTAKASEGIICPSPFLAKDLMSYCFVDEKKIHVIPNGVDLKLFDEIENLDRSFLDKYSIQPDNFLLYVGRLTFVKGVQYLIESFRIVKKKYPALQLVIAGSGDFGPQLRRIARNTKDVIFVGHINSIAIKKLLYSSSLAVVLPSHLYEVSPLTILEGMANGKPVVATNVGGNSFIVNNGSNGFLAEPKNPENLAKYIDILCGDEVLRRKMGKQGKKLVAEEFSLDKMVSRTLKLYELLS